MFYWYHVVVRVLDLYFMLEWPLFGRNGQVHITVRIGATFIKPASAVHLDVIYWYHLMVCVLDLHFTLEWPLLGRNGQVHITIPICATINKLAKTVHLHMIYWCHRVVYVLDIHVFKWPWSRSNNCSLYYSTHWCNIHQTCWNSSS